MKKLLLIMFVLINILVLCDVIPNWYVNNGNSEYSTENYFVGLGEGENYKAAERAAQFDIASQIKTNINGSIESNTVQSVGDSENYSKKVELNVKAVANEVLIGVEFVKKEKIGKSFYVLAVLEKSKYLLGLKTELDKIKNEIKKYDKLNADPFILSKNYLEAQEKLESFYKKKIIYDAMSKSEYTVSPYFEKINFTTRIKEITSNIYLKVVYGENQVGKEGEVLKNPIIFEARYKENIIPNFPVLIKDAKGKTIDKFMTDSNGDVKVYATVFTDESRKGKVEASVDLLKVPYGLKDYFKNIKVYANYSRKEEKTIKFSVKILNKEKKEIKSINKNIINLITKSGNTISEESNLTFVGKVSVDNIEEIESYSGTMYVANVSLELSIIENKSNLILSNMSFKGKGMGNNKSQAIKSAYNKMKISQKKFSIMISEAKRKLN